MNSFYKKIRFSCDRNETLMNKETHNNRLNYNGPMNFEWNSIL